MSASAVFVASTAVLLFGCAAVLQPKVSSIGSQKPHSEARANTNRPFVGAGTLFSVQMDQAIDTYFTAPGASYTATVATPLFGSKGELIVASGAKVYGTVVSVGSYEEPRLRLALESIDTVRGKMPIRAAVRQSQYLQWLAPDPLDFAASARTSYRSLPETNSYQMFYGYNLSQPREVHIPAGAIVGLALVDPLELPY